MARKIDIARSRAFIGHPQATERRVKIPCVHATWRDLRVWWQLRYYPAYGEWPETWGWLASHSDLIPGKGIVFGQMSLSSEDRLPPGLTDEMRAAMMVARLNNQI